MEIIGIRTPIFNKGDPLAPFIIANLPMLEEQDILVISSKLLALSQERVIPLTNKEDYLSSHEGESVVTPWGPLVYVNNEWMLNGGSDESNGNGELVLFPQEPLESLRVLHSILTQHYGIGVLGIICADSRSIPLRKGTVGRSIASVGFTPLKSYMDVPDLYGRISRVTISNIVDPLASSAVLLMGEGREQIPLVRIRNAPVTWGTNTSEDENLAISPKEDLYSHLFK